MRVDTLVRAVSAIEAINRVVGKGTAWLTLATVLICATVVLLRYMFGIGYVWMQELYVWTHAMTFLLASGFAYLLNAHVRVDIFYAGMSQRGRAWVDLCGVVFLLMPWLALLGWTAWTYVSYSWLTNERSVQNDGMPAVYVLKATMLGFVALLGLQGLAWIGRSVLVLAGRQPPPAETLTGPAG
ncbi:C4-dicarboxylate ABC transporter substrate-binding protein [Caldovatus sediminis]|uniref:TRAP transporter small permease protein n=1 Tax=Caldovatus sediminis TaxID=2041189 RepID=A0A8J3EAR7_9PROT|nr:C4-dicarboxylate ABC transporter substrate-binding protein [Caldovatus sediminis]